MTLLLEAAVFSVQDALKAESLGASRVEFNAPGSYPQGGLTPPKTDVQELSSKISVPMRIMIRPRGPPSGDLPDFIYSLPEMEEMQYSIRELKAANVMKPERGDAFVFGILKEQPDSDSPSGTSFTIDEDSSKALINLASPIPCVFHRAFDPIASSSQWQAGLDTLTRCGFVGVLTAGGKQGKYYDNTARLLELCEHAKNNIQIIAGGGVRSQNISGPAQQLAPFGTDNVWVHTAAFSDDQTLDATELENIISKLRV